jgi:hypothetical protein
LDLAGRNGENKIIRRPGPQELGTGACWQRSRGGDSPDTQESPFTAARDALKKYRESKREKTVQNAGRNSLGGNLMKLKLALLHSAALGFQLCQHTQCRLALP